MSENKMKKYADKYFLRSNEILKKEGMNPWVNMQVFVRKGPGKVAGVEEAIETIVSNSNIVEVGGRVYAKRDGDVYTPSETQMNIVAPIQSIMELETVYLGIIAAATTRENDKRDLDLNAITRNVEEVVSLANGRPVSYFGARHWDYREDAAITKAAFDGGVTSCSTDNGAEQFGLKGMGTIPHALENVMAFYYGTENAVVKATEAFDKWMDYEIPRVALIDYNNKEITDSIATANALRVGETGMFNVTALSAVRVDTCGENIAEGGMKGNDKYWNGTGVNVEGVYALRQALDDMKLENRVGIVLTSGFSNPDKIEAFNEAEEKYGVQLYDAIGAGFLDGVRTSTADVVAVGNSADEVDFYSAKVDERNIIHKVGRPPKPNYELERRF